MEISVAQAQIFFLALTRVMATIIHVPVLGGRTIPNQVKLGLGFALTIVMIPWQPLEPGAELIQTIPYALAIAKEIFIGTLAGYASLLTFGALQIAGSMMGTGSGFSAGHVLNPALDDTGSPLDQLFLMTAFLLFLTINGHHLFLQGLQQLFTLLPINGAIPVISLERLVELTGGLIVAGIHMSLPLVGTLLLTDLTLGLLARVAPQVQVFFLGIPLKLGLGLLALTAAMVVMLPTINQLFKSLGERTLYLLGA